MLITYWTTEGRAMLWAEGIAREFRRSIRFDLGYGETLTIHKNDIISIEEE